MDGSLVTLAAFLAGLSPSLAVLAVRRAQGDRRARRVREHLGAPVAPGAIRTQARDAVITVEGPLGGEGVTSFHPRGVSLMEEANVYARTPAPAGPVWIEVGPHRVGLDPPLQVVLGAAEEHAIGEREPGVDRRVALGDRVVARGRLDFDPDEAGGGSDGSYRDPARTFRLLPEKDPAWPTRPIPLATAGTPRDRTRTPALIVVFAGVLAGVLLATGTLTIGRRLEVAAAVRRGATAGPPACAAQADALLDAGRPEAALALDCNDPRSQALAHWTLGEVEPASRAWEAARALDPDLEPSASEAQAHALAGRPLLARDVVRKMSQQWYRGPNSPEKITLECVADGFGRRGGDAEATRRLDGLPWKGGPECQAVLGDFGYRTAPDPLGGLYDAEQLKNRAGDGQFHDPYGVIEHGMAWTHLRPLALELAVLRQVDPPPGETARRIEWKHDKIGYAHHAVEIAAFLALMGERDRAPHYLDVFDRIDGITPPFPTNEPRTFDETETFRWSKVQAVAAATALLLDDGARLQRYLNGAEAHSRVVLAHHLDLVRDGRIAPHGGGVHWWHDLDLFAVAEDGAVLADALAARKTLARPVLAELLPRVRSHPEALRAWASGRLPPPCATCGLFTLAEHVGDRREVARLVGDKDLEARWTAVAKRLVDLILRRDGAPEVFELERVYERITKGMR